MNTLIIYDSRHGTAGECANILQSLLPGSVTVHKLGSPAPVPNLDAYDEVVIGGSIKAGSLQKSVKEYCEKERSRLGAKKLGFYLCALTPPDQARSYLSLFPEDLLDRASAKDCFGGAVRYEGMNFLERFIMKKITKSSVNIEKIDRDRIAAFAKALSAG
jgi:menaquinone-dependent protoporphyrinogen oxidase